MVLLFGILGMFGFPWITTFHWTVTCLCTDPNHGCLTSVIARELVMLCHWPCFFGYNLVFSKRSVPQFLVCHKHMWTRLFLLWCMQIWTYDFMSNNSLNYALYMQKHMCAIPINNVHMCLCHTGNCCTLRLEKWSFYLTMRVYRLFYNAHKLTPSKYLLTISSIWVEILFWHLFWDTTQQLQYMFIELFLIKINFYCFGQNITFKLIRSM